MPRHDLSCLAQAPLGFLQVVEIEIRASEAVPGRCIARRLRQHLFVTLRRCLELFLVVIRRAELVASIGMFGGKLERRTKRRYRLITVPLDFEHPTEALATAGVSRVGFHRTSKRRAGRLEPTQLVQHQTEILQRKGVARILTQKAPIGLLGPIEAARLVQ